MPRLQGPAVAAQILHITQRCHDKQFLLSADCERRRWLYWLYQAKRTYRLSVLNYVVTSNHIHLLLQDPGRKSLEAAMQLINTRTEREFNKRLHRRGDFWEAGYAVTAIQTNRHLARCMNYIDMNMVRAGEVLHPRMWTCSGYHESLYPRKRGARLDHSAILALLRFDSGIDCQSARDRWINEKLESAELCREAYWTDSIAVGDLAFALKMKRALAFTHPGRRAQREHGCFAVR